jgi:Uma2 family endonuclease
MTVALKTHHRFRVEDYYRLGETGILGPEDRVELIDGEVIDMTPIGSGHAGCVSFLNRKLVQALGDSAVTHVQNPLRLSEVSEPQPDLTVLRAREDDYRGTHPTPADVLLLVEVAHTSIAYDREVKVSLYARHGIPQVWLVDLSSGTLIDFRQPTADGYRFTRVLEAGDLVQAAEVPGLELAVADILG